MKLSVFVGTSLDGFIARRNGRYDFLPAGGGEPHGYDEFIASVDTILIGRNTFEVVLKLPRWPYRDKRVVVLSHRPLDFSGVTECAEQMSGDPAQIAQELAAAAAPENQRCSPSWASPTAVGGDTRPIPSPSSVLRRRSGWSRSSRPSRSGFAAECMLARVRSAHGFGRSSTNTTRCPEISGS